ncbi:DUF4168 domain-containing protein [Altericista sp. CCNU0014]|uniref:DUF4168 domain-containing protein n=1 Tax=Altericista sp. CCNU0014 TaxID=3082949 RepID=UPI00384F5705
MIHSALSRSIASASAARGWGILLLACCAWLTGIVPTWSGQGVAQITWSSAVAAQSASKIRSYAEAVLEIEPLRRKAYKDVRRMMNGNLPNDVCRQDRLPSNVKSVCSSFFDESANIIRRNNLSIGEFNELTQRSQSDSGLMNLIQQELVRQQQR